MTLENNDAQRSQWGKIMARGARTDGPAPTEAAPRSLGVRVWLLRDGCFGRVVASSQGGLLCRVQLEDGRTQLQRPGSDLLPIAEAG